MSKKSTASISDDFYAGVRENIVAFLVFLGCSITAYRVVQYYRWRPVHLRHDPKNAYTDNATTGKFGINDTLINIVKWNRSPRPKLNHWTVESSRFNVPNTDPTVNNDPLHLSAYDLATKEIWRRGGPIRGQPPIIKSSVISNTSSVNRDNSNNRIEDDNDDDDDGDDETLFTQLLCVLALAAVVFNLVWLPGTVLLEGVMHWSYQHYYWQWLNTSLVAKLHQYAIYSANIAVYALLPIAYFYSEAVQNINVSVDNTSHEHHSHGKVETRKTSSSSTDLRENLVRLREAIINWLLVATLAAGGVFVAASMLGVRGVAGWLGVLDGWMAVVCSLVAIHCVPRGCLRLFERLRRWPIPLWHRHKVQESIDMIEFEEAVWQRRLASTINTTPNQLSVPTLTTTTTTRPRALTMPESQLNIPISVTLLPRSKTPPTAIDTTTTNTTTISSGITGDYGLTTYTALHRLRQLTNDRQLAQAEMRISPTWRNSGFLLLSIITTVSWWLLQLRVALAIIRGLVTLAVPLKEGTLDPLLWLRWLPASELTSGMLRAMLLVYFTACLFTGVYDTSIMRRIWPRPGRSTIKVAVANIAVCIVLAAGLPILTAILGLSDSASLADAADDLVASAQAAIPLPPPPPPPESWYITLLSPRQWLSILWLWLCNSWTLLVNWITGVDTSNIVTDTAVTINELADSATTTPTLTSFEERMAVLELPDLGNWGIWLATIYRCIMLVSVSYTLLERTLLSTLRTN
jgi:hypothetical protein